MEVQGQIRIRPQLKNRWFCDDASALCDTFHHCAFTPKAVSGRVSQNLEVSYADTIVFGLIV